MSDTGRAHALPHGGRTVENHSEGARAAVEITVEEVDRLLEQIGRELGKYRVLACATWRHAHELAYAEAMLAAAWRTLAGV